MKHPTREFRGATWVGWLNLLVLQWLFMRLAYNMNNEWFILRWVIPRTGWGEGKFQYIGGKRR